MMKKLCNLLENVSVEQLFGCSDQGISNLCFDSKEVHQNTLFVAVKGHSTDGHLFINQAIDNGAVAIVCEVIPEKRESVTYVQVGNSALALGLIADHFFDHPSQKLSLIGITGTNGKTTTVTLLHQMFLKMGYSAGLLSTIVNKIGEEDVPATHTTPDPITLNRLLSRMVEAKCTFCFMEVSSHAIVQKRIAGLRFAGGIFSNITHDHLDFHKTFAEYIHAKKRFFDQLPKTAFALVNKDDKNGAIMVQNTAAKVYTYSLKTPSDFHATIIENTIHGIEINIDSVGNVYTQLVGKFNAYNLLAIYSTAVLCGMDKGDCAVKLSDLKAAEGRFERIVGKRQTAIVDYAHTPDALQNVLETLNHVRADNEHIITVIGCGGNRDPLKRPAMAEISARLSDKAILTSDNPRNENPEHILDDMEKGLNATLAEKTIRISNRAEAIRAACSFAKEKDIILVAGKGHEKYQEINGTKHHFDDKEELLKWLK